jgi:L-ascorbate metabolism protein UlaG (beta-lactamase superfamily)
MASVVTDPYDDSVGLTLSRPRADIVTISHDIAACNYARGARGPFRVLNTPGEYEIGDVFITGIATFADKKKGKARGLNTVFHFDYNSLTVCHLGRLGHVPTQAQIEALGTVDILLAPVSGNGGLRAAETAEVVSLLEPSIVIPMWYKIPGATPSKGTLNPFLKQMGIEKTTPQESLKVNRSSLPSSTGVVILKPKLD